MHNGSSVQNQTYFDDLARGSLSPAIRDGQIRRRARLLSSLFRDCLEARESAIAIEGRRMAHHVLWMMQIPMAPRMSMCKK